MRNTILISGAGSGIGRATALSCAGSGYRVVLLGRNRQGLEESLSLLPGDGHLILKADIRSKEDLQRAVLELNGLALHGLIANAGVGGENHRGEADRWEEIIQTNLSGTYHFLNAFLPNLAPGREGFAHILLLSSVLARLGVANYTAYCASKAGLLGLMRSLAVELAPKKILVNAVCPGWVDTEMAKSGMEKLAGNLGVSVSEFHDIAMESVPLKKMSKPEEIGELCLYLLRQTSITGQTIDINNGAVMNS